MGHQGGSPTVQHNTESSRVRILEISFSPDLSQVRTGIASAHNVGYYIRGEIFPYYSIYATELLLRSGPKSGSNFFSGFRFFS